MKPVIASPEFWLGVFTIFVVLALIAGLGSGLMVQR